MSHHIHGNSEAEVIYFSVHTLMNNADIAVVNSFSAIHLIQLPV